jgi:hypothetical protein
MGRDDCGFDGALWRSLPWCARLRLAAAMTYQIVPAFTQLQLGARQLRERSGGGGGGGRAGIGGGDGAASGERRHRKRVAAGREGGGGYGPFLMVLSG